MRRQRASGMIRTPLRLSLFLVFAVFLLCVFVYGFFFGTMTQTVQIQGIAFPQGGIRRVVASQAGCVQQVLIKTGDVVQQGDLIAVIPQDSILQQAAASPQVQREYTAESLIYAPVSGMVSDSIAVGASVQVGDSLANIIAQDAFSNQSEIRAFVPVAVAAQFRRGMQVWVTTDTVAREQSGYANGFINQISTFPLTQDKITEDLSGFQAPRNGSDAEHNLIEVRITLADSPDVGTGVICNMEVVLQQVTPIEFL